MERFGTVGNTLGCRSARLKDLAILTACSNCRYAIAGILTQYTRLGVRNISHEIFVHPYRDPGCFCDPNTILRQVNHQFHKAIVVLDFEGSGGERKYTAQEMEEVIEDSLSRNGWSNRCCAIVIQPELEQWVWSGSPLVARILWPNVADVDLGEWLERMDFGNPNYQKPLRPKEAMEAALRYVNRPRSSAIYKELAERVPFDRCKDRSFIKLRDALKNWFSET